MIFKLKDTRVIINERYGLILLGHYKNVKLYNEKTTILHDWHIQRREFVMGQSIAIQFEAEVSPRKITLR